MELNPITADTTTTADLTTDTELATADLIEEVSIDGMCGVY